MDELIWFLVERRKSLKLSQKELAVRMGSTSQSYIADLETGRCKSVRLETLNRWASALDYPKVSIGFTNSRSHRLIPLNFEGEDK